MVSLFFIAFIVGFVISLPVGPVSLLTIRRSYRYGASAGFLTGLGGITADMIYGFFAGWGVFLISDILNFYLRGLSLIGAIILVVLGVKILMEKPFVGEVQATHATRFRHFFSGFGITLSNPGNFLLFGSIFLFLHKFSPLENLHSIIFALIGIFIGATVYWLILSLFVAHIKHKIVPEKLMKFNRIFGIVIILFALVLALKFI